MCLNRESTHNEYTAKYKSVMQRNSIQVIKPIKKKLPIFARSTVTRFFNIKHTGKGKSVYAAQPNFILELYTNTFK